MYLLMVSFNLGIGNFFNSFWCAKVVILDDNVC